MQQFFVEHLIYRLSRSLMRPFSRQLTPWFALPMPVFVEPTCGRIGSKESTKQAGKSAMNGWALLRRLAQRFEPSSEEIEWSLLMTSVMGSVSSVAKDLIALACREVSGVLDMKADRPRRFELASQTRR